MAVVAAAASGMVAVATLPASNAIRITMIIVEIVNNVHIIIVIITIVPEHAVLAPPPLCAAS
eukprot:3492113-Pleurochrysis_carterae.AAC.1